VLVVDDHAQIRELVRTVLEGAGYAVREAADGAEALRLARAAPPAVILLDVGMPVLDGPGFVAAYRRAPGPHAPVVVLTAAAAAARWAAELEAAGHLGKPFGLAALLAAVGRLAAPKGRGAGAA
jgi:two-component system, chemotaxis family, chemotaxis protein CheY